MCKVLLIEDDPGMINMYRRAFAYEGYKVAVAKNGRLGFGKAKAWLPNVILLDIMMPVMNGMEALHVLKKRKPPKTSQ